jgi:Rieske Fe-S protein
MNECSECRPGDNSGPKVETTRRRFLVALIATASALLGAILGIPFISAVTGSGSGSQKDKWVKVAELQSIPEGEPVSLNFSQTGQDAFMLRTTVQSVWVVRTSPAEITAYSPICPHAGCYYNWNAQLRRFACPCHASIFEINGPVVSGPAPRPLDTLPVRIENGTLFVIWKRFKAGVADKTAV